MTLGADDVQAARGQHPFVTALPFFFCAIDHRRFGMLAECGELGLETTAEHDVSAAARQIGGDGHTAGAPSLRYDLCLALVLFGVEPLILAYHRPMRGDLDDFETIYLLELVGLGVGRAGHALKFFVET